MGIITGMYGEPDDSLPDEERSKQARRGAAAAARPRPFSSHNHSRAAPGREA